MPKPNEIFKKRAADIEEAIKEVFSKAEGELLIFKYDSKECGSENNPMGPGYYIKVKFADQSEKEFVYTEQFILSNCKNPNEKEIEDEILSNFLNDLNTDFAFYEFGTFLKNHNMYVESHLWKNSFQISHLDSSLKVRSFYFGEEKSLNTFYLTEEKTYNSVYRGSKNTLRDIWDINKLEINFQAFKDCCKETFEEDYFVYKSRSTTFNCDDKIFKPKFILPKHMFKQTSASVVGKSMSEFTNLSKEQSKSEDTQKTPSESFWFR